MQPTLPPMIEEGIIQPELKAILQRRMVKKGSRVVTEVLVKWQGTDEEDATWENYYKLKEKYPNLEDKVV